MVDQRTGKWYEEKNYDTYPKEKWCDYDYMAAWIRKQNYEPKTTMENLIIMMFAYYEMEIDKQISEYDAEYFKGIYVEACQAYIIDNGGIQEFDYWA